MNTEISYYLASFTNEDNVHMMGRKWKIDMEGKNRGIKEGKLLFKG